MPRAETAVLTLLALVAFASNSLLNRLALAGHHVDAASFTAIRLASGALVLFVLVRLRRGGGSASGRRRWAGPVALFAYAAPFSLAYLRLGAAVGALVLFGTVQLTMMGWGLARHGDRPSLRTTAALAVAAGGLLGLLLPSATRPDPLGIGLMVLAGVAWGVYSLLGKGVADPLAANARNFSWSVPLALVFSLASLASWSVTLRGALLAAISGGVTSALGYAIWYRALRGLTATQAAIVQLSVPVIAALGATLVLGETLGTRLLACGVAVICGVGLALSEQRRRA
jgi:drug/metabolite transporter (DMT)-like permease